MQKDIKYKKREREREKKTRANRGKKKWGHNGSFKKKCQQNCLSVFYWTLLLFYSDKVHKQ